MRSEVDRGTTFSVYLPCSGRTSEVTSEQERRCLEATARS